MPKDEDVAQLVRGDGASAIEPPSRCDEVTFSLKACAGIVDTGVQHGHAVLRICAVPNNVDASTAADGELGAADVANGDRRFFGIHLNGARERLAVIFGLAVDNVRFFGSPYKVDEVEDSVFNDELGLDSSVGYAQGFGAGRCGFGGERANRHGDSGDAQWDEEADHEHRGGLA